VVRTATVESGSTAERARLKRVFSVTLCAPIKARIGDWLPASVTVMATISESERRPSEAMNVTLYTPAWVKAGSQSKVAVPSPLSTRVAPSGRLTASNDGSVVSASLAERPKFKLTFSTVVCAPITASTGGWLPASMTVTATTSESIRKPSVA